MKEGGCNRTEDNRIEYSIYIYISYVIYHISYIISYIQGAPGLIRAQSGSPLFNRFAHSAGLGMAIWKIGVRRLV